MRNRGGKATFVTEVSFGLGWTGDAQMFAIVTKLDGLDEINIGARIDKSTMEPLSQIPKLRSVRLRNPDVRDEDLRFLAGIPVIERVTLMGPFSDEAVPVLGKVAQLVDRSDSPWDDATRRPSHANRRKALRQQILRNELLAITTDWSLPRKIIQLTKSLMALTGLQVTSITRSH